MHCYRLAPANADISFLIRIVLSFSTLGVILEAQSFILDNFTVSPVR